ncbi:hypothetical protein KI387_013928, partial [Taxus chinensis]
MCNPIRNRICVVIVRWKSDKRAWESTSNSSSHPTSRGRAETADGDGIYVG